MSFDGGDERTALRSVSFNGRDSEPIMMKSFGSGKMIFEGSLSFRGRELETSFSFRGPSSPMSREIGEKLAINSKTPKMASWESSAKRFQAALRLQKVYKSFRTRRQLADCAVLVEQRWWKLLDFAELRRSSISFFDIEKPETALSRWSRARTRAAKVGKGLSKDERARKLALQHWLEATERKAYEVIVEDGKFFYRQTGKLLDTRGGPEDAKWIFVLSTSKTLYVGQKNKGTFQHSSFLAGGATLSAGRIVVEDGILKAVWPHSGHYLPTEENFEEFMQFLKEHNVDLSIVQKSPTDEEEEAHGNRRREAAMQNNFTAPQFVQVAEEIHSKQLGPDKTDSRTQDCNNAKNPHLPLSRFSRRLHSNITTLQIPRKDYVIQMFKKSEQQGPADTPMDGYETAEEVFSSDDEFTVSKYNLFDEDEESDYEEPIPKEKIIQRINSHKGTKSYQLAQRLSCRWTTGAGPRIGCVRDYPPELQNRALEEVNLSPRRLLRPSPRILTPTSLCRENNSGRSPLAVEQVILQQIATP
ncbi:hypothetical protein U1Q18_012710 [Sarracenia purpurea var. burkii]